MLVKSTYLQKISKSTKNLTFRTRKNKKIDVKVRSRKKRITSDKQKNRVKKYLACVEKYKKLTEEEKKQYEILAKQNKTTAYVEFMRNCLSKIEMQICTFSDETIKNAQNIAYIEYIECPENAVQTKQYPPPSSSFEVILPDKGIKLKSVVRAHYYSKQAQGVRYTVTITLNSNEKIIVQDYQVYYGGSPRDFTLQTRQNSVVTCNKTKRTFYHNAYFTQEVIIERDKQTLNIYVDHELKETITCNTELNSDKITDIEISCYDYATAACKTDRIDIIEL